MDSRLLKQFKAARQVATPLIFIKTPDPAATISFLCRHALHRTGKTDTPAPQLSWDVVRGIAPIADENGDASEQSRKAVSDMADAPQKIIDPIECLDLAHKLPGYSALFFLNAHRYLQRDEVMQAIWNLRDQFKSNKRTLIMLGPDVDLPQELKFDILVLDEPLPTPEELADLITEQYAAAKAGTSGDFPDLTDTTIQRAVDATVGLSSFAAEQVAAMSIDRKLSTGIDIAGLWERKRRSIEQTPGLSVWSGAESFSDLKGLDNAIKFLSQWLHGSSPIRAILFMDEIEKMLAGISGDNTGVTQDMFGVILQWMQDTRSMGALFVGPPGSGKSQCPKAAGNLAGIPTIKCDLGGMKAGEVGKSEKHLRDALKIASAVSRDCTMVIATCNKIEALPPELRRRFPVTMFFDLPSPAARADIWKVYRKKFQIDAKDQTPESTDWTGAEIENACRFAHQMKCKLTDAEKFIVPVAKSASEQIAALRSQAQGRFISASYEGLYKLPSAGPTRRAISED